MDMADDGGLTGALVPPKPATSHASLGRRLAALLRVAATTASRPQGSNEYLMDDDEFADDLRAARAAMSPVEVAAREGLSSEALRRLDRADVDSYRRRLARGGATSFATTDGYDRGPPPSGDPFHSIVCGLSTGLPVVPKAPGRPVVVGSVILSGIDATATVQAHFVGSAVFRLASVGANEVVDGGVTFLDGVATYELVLASTSAAVDAAMRLGAATPDEWCDALAAEDFFSGVRLVSLGAPPVATTEARAAAACVDAIVWSRKPVLKPVVPPNVLTSCAGDSSNGLDMPNSYTAPSRHTV